MRSSYFQKLFRGDVMDAVQLSANQEEVVPGVLFQPYLTSSVTSSSHYAWTITNTGTTTVTLPYNATWPASTAAVTLNYGTTYETPTTLYVNATAGSTWTINVNDAIIAGAANTGYFTHGQDTPLTLAKRRIKRQLTQEGLCQRRFLEALRGPEEQKARNTLRDMISEQEWRRYVTNAFLMVRGSSGRWYQVFADQRHTQVFERGKNIAGLCIHSDRTCPPSDHVINLKLLVEFDEPALWAGANVTWHSPGITTGYYQEENVPEPANLLELWRRAKKTG